MLRALTPLLVVACANPSQGVTINRIVPNRAEIATAQPVTIEGTFHVLTTNLDEGDTRAALVTATVDTTAFDATWVSQEMLTATMPALPEGVYDVTVSIDGRSATLDNGYIVGNPPLDAGGNVTGTHSITVTGPVAGGPHINFPLLVDLQDARLGTIANGGEVANDQGFDIFFSLDQAGTMHLSHEIEKYTVDGELVVWVKVPSLAPGFQFFIHMGDPAVTMPQGNPTDVWSEGYAAVWHMGPLQDATANNNDATDSGTVGIVDSGQIEQARTYDGASSTAQVSPAASVNNVFDGGGTAEAWFNATSAGQNNFGRLFEKGLAGGWTLSFCDGNGVANSILFAQVFSTSTVNWCTDANLVALDSWFHVAVVYSDDSSANRPTIFINGVPHGVNGPQPSGTRVSDAPDPLVIGNRQPGARAFAGAIDEARLSRTVRSAEWIKTSFDNQNDPNNFVTLGP